MVDLAKPDVARIGAVELRRDLADVLDTVGDGIRVEIVDRRGRVRAMLVPPPRLAPAPAEATA